MSVRNWHGMTMTAAIGVMLALTACSQRGNEAAAPSGNSPTASAPTTDASQKLASATDKVAGAVDDSAITAKVKAALLAEPGLRSLEIDVDTKTGIVTLSGSVDSAASRDRAKQVASGVAGVTTIVDHLTLKS